MTEAERADLLTRFRANRANLERSRSVHEDWRVWMEKASPEERKRNEAVGDADWHRNSVAMYDERIACMNLAIKLVEEYPCQT